jgi:RNA polymerase sigma-70 factor (ECF subfamily)
VASGTCSSARSSTFASASWCNEVARPVFRRATAGEEAPRVRHLDRDRPAVAAAQLDPKKFDDLYRRYLPRVYSYAYYELGDHHAAEDATERTFLSALANLDRFEERAVPADGEGASTFRVWLFQIARNVVANERRTARRRRTEPIVATSVVVDPLDVEGDVLRREEASAAWRAVGRLEGDRRRALVLRFVDEMSTAEIAGVLGRSEGAVRVLIHRALRSVARDLGPREGSGGARSRGHHGAGAADDGHVAPGKLPPSRRSSS